MFKKNLPSIWVTSIAKLMAGDKSCVKSEWVKANMFRDDSEKVKSDFDFKTWSTEHNKILHEHHQFLVNAGFEVKVEAQNSFRYSGRTIRADVAGKPDLIAVSGNQGEIVDVKTGSPRESHITQTKLYMWLIPNVMANVYNGITLDGRVLYRDHSVHIPANEVDDEFKGIAIDFINMLSAEQEPLAIPSYWDCRFCDVKKEHCPERQDEQPTYEEKPENLF